MTHWQSWMWGVALAVFASGASPIARASTSTPEQALVELVLAPDAETAEKHLPNSVLEGLRTLTPEERQGFETRLRFVEAFRRMGMEVRAPEDGSALLVAEKPASGEKCELRVERQIVGGGDAMLRLVVDRGQQAQQRFQVWMKLEGGDWRITEVSWPYRYGGDLVLDDPKFLEQFRRPHEKENEQAALGILYNLHWAVKAYSERYPEVGYPEDLSVLGPAPEGEEEDSEHAGFLEALRAANSFQSDGYVFHYEQRRGGSNGAYSITARPAQYGKTGTQSYYLDTSGVLRATKENRDPTVDDEPTELQQPESIDR